MRNLQYNKKTKLIMGPDDLENTRDPKEYVKAVVDTFNERAKYQWTIDPAKARVLEVRQISTRPWEARVRLGEDIKDAEGNFVETKQKSAIITRQKIQERLHGHVREVGETPFVTRNKVAAELGLEGTDLVGGMSITGTTQSQVYQVNNLNLNFYGQITVTFVYEEAEAPEPEVP